VEYLQAVILGIVEGLTEFVPVSSTGHMIIAQPLLGVDPTVPMWRVFLFVSQIGAILAVVVYFWRDLWRRVFKPPSRHLRDHILTKLFVAMVPTVLLGLTFNDLMERYLEGNPPAVAAALILGAVAIELIDRKFRRDVPMELEDVSLRQAFLIGAIQCISMWPGVSRAGASIMGGMALGLSPRVATEFSFYLAIPTMLAAGAKRCWDYRADLAADGAGVVLVGTAVAFVVALVVVAAFMHYVRRHRFTPFAIYRVLLGSAVLLFYFAWR
jgi:undecaprenyl-diphosphatase